MVSLTAGYWAFIITSTHTHPDEFWLHDRKDSNRTTRAQSCNSASAGTETQPYLHASSREPLSQSPLSRTAKSSSTQQRGMLIAHASRSPGPPPLPQPHQVSSRRIASAPPATHTSRPGQGAGLPSLPVPSPPAVRRPRSARVGATPQRLAGQPLATANAAAAEGRAARREELPRLRGVCWEV